MSGTWWEKLWWFLRRGKESWQERSFPFSRFPRGDLCPRPDCPQSPSSFLLLISILPVAQGTFPPPTSTLPFSASLTSSLTMVHQPCESSVMVHGSSSTLSSICPSNCPWCSWDSQNMMLNSAGLGSFYFHLVLLNQKPGSSVKTSTMSWWLLHIENRAQCLEQSRLKASIWSLLNLPLASVWQYFSPSLVDPLWSSVISYSLFPSLGSLLSFPPPSLLSPFLLKIPPEGKFIPSTSYKPDISLLSSSCSMFVTQQF